MPTPKKSTKKVVKKVAKKAVAKAAPKKKAAAKKQSNKLIVMTSPVDSNIRIMVASEQMDDQLIEKEMMGQALPYYIYQFCDNRGDRRCDAEIVKAGRCPHEKIVGLSFKGVSEVVRRLNRNTASGYKIRINPEHLKKEEVEREGSLGIEVSVYAEDLITGNSAWGVKFEPYFKKKKNGGQYTNTFATEKALSKAERNAKRKLIPETPAALMIQKLMQENQGQHVMAITAPTTTTAVVLPQVPKASTAEDLLKVVLWSITKSKDMDTVLNIDEKAQESDKLTAEMKKQIHEAALMKANSFQE